MRKTLVLALAVLLLLTGCTAARQLGAGLFTGAKLTDTPVDGVVTARPQSVGEVLVSLTVDQGAANLLRTAVDLAGRQGQVDRFGVVLAVALPGETRPLFVVCPAGKVAASCAAFLPMEPVRAYSHPGPAGLLVADRVVRP